MDRELIAIAALSVAIALFLTYFGYMRYETFSMSACGIGIYLQSLYNFCLGKPFYNTINGNLLRWRFEPILFLIAPLFCLFKTPLVLIAIQAIAISATIPLVYLLSRRLVNSPLLFTSLFLVSPVFIGLSLYDFSTIALSAPLLFLILLALEEKKLKTFLLSSALFLMTSSIAGILLISIGFFLSTRFEGERRLWGNLLMLIGTLGLATSLIIMQKLNPGWLWYRASHVDPFFLKRLIVVTVMLSHFIFIPFLTTEGAISLVPLLTISLLYRNEPYFFIGTYMPAPFYLLVTVISLYTVSALREERLLKYAIPFSLFLFITFNPFHSPFGSFDFVVYYALPKMEEHQLFLNELVEKLPNVPMIVQSNIFTHLYYRDNVYVDYREGVKLAVMDSSSIWYPYIATALLLKERFKNGCELFNIPLPQIVRLLNNPAPFVNRYAREFKVALAYDNVVVATREKVKINVSYPKDIIGVFFSDMNFKRRVFTMAIFRLYLDWKAWSPYVTVPADRFSAIFEGKVRLGKGTYTFYIHSDDGSFMTLNNTVLFDCMYIGPCFDVYVMRSNGGIYNFKIKYMEYTGNALIKVFFKKEGWRKVAYLNSTVER